MDRTLVEASYDLFATPWRTFWQITFPQLLPAIVAGFLLSFTFAFDDYLITTFVNGRGTSTLPLYVFGQIKVGVTPATNAIAALMLLITLDPARRPVLLTRQARRAGGRRVGRRGRRVGPTIRAAALVAAQAAPSSRRQLRSSRRTPAAADGPAQASTATGSGTRIPASAASSAALSVRSHGRSRSGRPKWPYAAVWR